ncbi:hypothetical protein Ddye_020120 [Dipteronia dyeriana]|uniref:Uncharacterized protein n=1 Tax=Dipteronia dyeriana TaxID=168575 RepID=A0AAD9WWR3_9ROSI|nr:hypothetical protein Ddye_020120 [Dipteronia dyeriana]
MREWWWWCDISIHNNSIYVLTMGRRIPISGDELIHPVLTFTLLIAALGATISMILSLCIRRKSSPPPPNQSSPVSSPEFKTSEISSSELFDNNNNPTAQADTLESGDKTEIDDVGLLQNKELPLPPAMKQKQLRETNSCNNLTKSTSKRIIDTTNIKKSMSTRKIDTSLSLKMPRSLSVMTQDREEKNRKKGKLKHEDSIWTKTIILGEKCKVSEEDDDAIIYDNGGNRISAYHKKTHSTMSLSRQNSHNIDPTAILAAAGQDKDKGLMMMTNEQVNVSSSS